jgi:predicted phosphodiesterase
MTLLCGNRRPAQAREQWDCATRADPLSSATVAQPVIRIISDLHYGDRASGVRDLVQLQPLGEGAAELILNGDTLDTRPGPNPAITRELRETVLAFAHSGPAPIRLLTGNHDPDISTAHLHELAAGRVLLTHGDVVYENMVPWGQDADLAGRLVAGERERIIATSLEDHLLAHRLAAAAIPQRHQTEHRGWQYLKSFVADTVWPPDRIPRILRAWTELPERGARLLRAHRPHARCLIVGHTHWPGWWRRADGLLIINTGSFCPPLGCRVVEISGDRLTLRRVVRRQDRFHPGVVLAEFDLARL